MVRYAAKFDGATLRPRDFASQRRARRRRRAAFPSAQPPGHRPRPAHSIRAFNRRGLPAGWTAANAHGAVVGEKFDPIRPVGLYIPGGEVPLVSTVLMTATLARIAGCPQIAACSPGFGRRRGRPASSRRSIWSGVDEVYRIGGVQAIGAMAYRDRDDSRGRQDLRPGQRLRLRGQAPGFRHGRRRPPARPERTDGHRRRTAPGRLRRGRPPRPGRARLRAGRRSTWSATSAATIGAVRRQIAAQLRVTARRLKPSGELHDLNIANKGLVVTLTYERQTDSRAAKPNTQSSNITAASPNSLST